MDWLCPPFHERLHELLKQSHGHITAELAIRTILPGLNSGNLQSVIYDLTYQKVYFSYGYINDQNKKIDAYKRPYIGLDLVKLFAHKNE